MKKLLPLTFTILTSIFATTANAENAWYLGALYSSQEVSSNGRNHDVAGIVVGYQFNNYLGLESRVSKGTSDSFTSLDTPNGGMGHFTEEFDTQASLSMKVSYPVFASINLYGLAGYTTTKVKRYYLIDNKEYRFKGSESGVSYGLGIDYQVSDEFNVFLDYQVFSDFSPFSNISESWKGTTLGISYSF